MISDILADFLGSLINAIILMGIFYLLISLFLKNKKIKAMNISLILYIVFISLLSYYVTLINPLPYILSGTLIFLVYYLYNKKKKVICPDCNEKVPSGALNCKNCESVSNLNTQTENEGKREISTKDTVEILFNLKRNAIIKDDWNRVKETLENDTSLKLNESESTYLMYSILSASLAQELIIVKNSPSIYESIVEELKIAFQNLSLKTPHLTFEKVLKYHNLMQNDLNKYHGQNFQVLNTIINGLGIENRNFVMNNDNDYGTFEKVIGNTMEETAVLKKLQSDYEIVIDLSVNKNNQYTKVDEFFELMDSLFLHTFYSLKDEFPEEVIWMFNTELNRGFTYYSRIIALYFTLINSSANQEIKDNITKRFYEKYPEYNEIFGHFNRVMWDTSENELVEDKKENQIIISSKTGIFIAYYIQKEYEMVEETYEFDLACAEMMGHYLLDYVFNQITPSIE